MIFILKLTIWCSLIDITQYSMEPATKTIVIVSLHFMILFTAFNAFQTIVTKIHEDEGDRSLGPFRFAVNYFVFMISNLFVSKVKYSEKWQITLSTLTYVFHYMTGFLISGTPTYVKYLVVALGAGVNGVGASFLWTSVGRYIHKVCHTYHKINIKGHYFGLFNTIFCSSSLLGAIIVTFGLSLFSHNVYFMIVSGIAFLSFLYGLIFIKDIPNIEQQNAKEEIKSQGFFALAIQSAKSTLKFYPVMKYSLGLIALDGLNLGVSTSTMLHLMPSSEDKSQNNLNAGICLILFGTGCILGGYIGGKLCDRLRIRLSSSILLYLYLMSTLFSVFASQIMQMWSARMSCFIWGFVLYYLTANLMVICSRLYHGRPESFALVKQFHSFVFCVYQIVAMTTNNSLPVSYIMFALFLFGMPAIWGIYRSPDEAKKQFNQQFVESTNSLKTSEVQG